MFKLIDSVFSGADLPEIDNDRATKGNPLNANFQKKEFQELWGRINQKAAYTVHFETPELVGKCIKALGKDLNVAPLQYTIQRGEQVDQATAEALKQGDGFKVQETETAQREASVHSTIKYDLIGKLAEQTQLTRSTIAAVLQGIAKVTFNQFKTNPEDFMLKAARLINEQKATVIVEHLAYDPVEDRHDMTIFTQEKPQESFIKAYSTKRHIYDYVFTDSKTEQNFVEQLDTSTEVVVYAKLPKSFFIPTPVGNYNPDWAIAFEANKVKHVYFIAETKGSMSTLDLRKIEESKVKCARKFFAEITSDQVRYDVVDSYGKLMEIVKGDITPDSSMEQLDDAITPAEAFEPVPMLEAVELVVAILDELRPARVTDSVESLGHDVGKTLLTRLIRYLLGEGRCADGRTRTAIQRKLPDSIIAGEFRVDGTDWAVMRPLGAPSTFVSRAQRVSGWRELLDVEGAGEEYTTFVQHISDAVLESISSPLLTNARRPIEWLDVLAWIARDQKCRYSHPLVWRHSDAESSTRTLHIEDASTVLRSVSGLMDAREKVFFEKHDKLLHKRQELTQEKARLERQIDAEAIALTSDMQELLKSSDVGISRLELEMIRGKTEGQRKLRAEEISNLNIMDLRTKYEMAVQMSADAAAQEKVLAKQVEAMSAHVKKREERPLSIYERFATMCDKQTDDCPAKLKIANQQVPTPGLDDVAELKQEIEENITRLAEVQSRQQSLLGDVKTRRHELSEAEGRLSCLTESIDGRIALYESMERRVDRQLQRMDRLTEAAKEYDDLTTQINQSLVRQNELRDVLALSRTWLPMRFSALCKELIGGSRQFELSVESKAIRLNIVGATGAPGEATSTSALVLSLDLAAIQAAIDGYGYHSRLMILDSPREADMEIGIFNRLMRRLSVWHRASPKPTFQMIVTTTTRPQEEDVPPDAIRGELARIPPNDLLLGVEL